MSNTSSPEKPKSGPITYILTGLVIAVLCGGSGYYAGRQTHKINEDALQNRVGYIVDRQAAEHVDSFYRQYIKPTNTVYLQRKFLEGYGSKNLLFYSAYYQHGFDPIVCSAAMPVAITISRARSGPAGTVEVTAEYPDGSTATLTASVVIGNDGLKVDSVTCPGDKGNLPLRL
jgi:hypothetical protein